MTKETKIGDRITYTIELAFGKGQHKTYGDVVAIKDCEDYKKILLHTGKEIYRAN